MNQAGGEAINWGRLTPKNPALWKNSNFCLELEVD